MSSAKTPDNWASGAEDILSHFASTEGATVERQQLTELLVGFEVSPRSGGGARVSVTTSPYEVIVQAGRGARFELDALPGSADELREILDAIAGGRLSERRDRLALTFRLEIGSGRTLSGRVLARGIPRGAIQYQPYPRRTGRGEQA